MALRGDAKVKLTVEQADAIAKLEQFKNKLRSLGKVAGALGGVFGTIGIGAFASKAVFTAARTRELGIVMETIGRTAGYTKSELYDLEQAIIPLGITTQGARNILIQMSRANLDLAKATDLARVAQDAAVISGENTSDALQGIINGIVTLQPRVLRHHGIVLTLEQAYRQWEQATGKQIENQDAMMKQQIALDAVIKYGTRIQGAYTAAMTEAGKRWRSLPRYVEEMFNALGEALFPAFEAMVDWLTRITKGIRAWGEANQELIKDEVQAWVERLNGALEKGADLVNNHGEAILTWSKIIVASAIIYKLAGVAQGVLTLATAIKAAGLASTFAMGPVGWIAAAIAGLTAVIIYQRSKVAEHTRELGGLGQEYMDLAKETGVLEARQAELQGKTKRTAAEEKELRDVTAELGLAQHNLNDVTEKLNGILPESATQLRSEASAAREDAVAFEMLLGNKRALYLQELMTKADPELEKLRATQDEYLALRKERLESRRLTDQPVPPTATQDFTYADDPLLTKYATDLERLKDLSADYADWKSEFEALTMGPPISLMGGAEDEAGDTTDYAALARKRAEQVKAATELLAKYQESAITDTFEKQRITVRDQYKKLVDTITGLDVLPDDVLTEVLAGLEDVRDKKMKAIDEKQAKAKLKREQEAADERVQVILDELGHLRDLYAWDRQTYIEHLALKRDAAIQDSEDRKLLEAELREAERAAAVETADAQRAATQFWKDYMVDAIQDVTRSWEGFGKALKKIGNDILNILVRRVLEDLIDQLWTATAAANALKAALSIFGGGPTQILEGGTGVTPPVYAQRGLITRGPTLTLAGEREPEVIAPVRSLLNAIAERDSTPRLVINMTIPALDAGSFDDYMKSEGIEVLERLVQRRWLNLGAT